MDTEGIPDQRHVAAIVRVAVKRQLKQWGTNRIGHDDADDLVGLVLESLYCSKRSPLELFDPTRSSAKRFIGMLTTRRLLDLARKQMRRNELDEQNAAQTITEETTREDPESLLQIREANDHLAHKLSTSASPTDREIFVEAFVEQRSNAEIAEKLDLPASRVTDRIFALRNQAARWLAAHNIFVKRRKT